MGILKDGILTLKWEPANLSATPAVEETETILPTGNGVRMLAWTQARIIIKTKGITTTGLNILGVMAT